MLREDSPARVMISPCISSTSRSTPWAAGCCGPKLSVKLFTLAGARGAAVAVRTAWSENGIAERGAISPGLTSALQGDVAGCSAVEGCHRNDNSTEVCKARTWSSSHVARQALLVLQKTWKLHCKMPPGC